MDQDVEAGLGSQLSASTACGTEQQQTEPEPAVEVQATTGWSVLFKQPFLGLRKSSRSKHNSWRRREMVRSLVECPKGYPRLAALLDSDESFMVYRRFGYIQSRLLLFKQDELRELEEDLDYLDRNDGLRNPSWLASREKDDALSGDRKKLLEKIELKFREYSINSIFTPNSMESRDLVALDCPPERDYMSVKYYFDGEVPLVHGESYIYRKEDIVSLKPGRESTWLDAFVESILLIFSCKLIRYIFSSSELRQKADARTTGVTLFKRERIEILVSLIITLMILILLVVPVWLLWRLEKTFQDEGSVLSSSIVGKIIGVLLSFTFIFSVVLLLFTRAKRHEILASAAAYCAVLVVFIGNVGQLSQNSATSSK